MFLKTRIALTGLLGSLLAGLNERTPEQFRPFLRAPSGFFRGNSTQHRRKRGVLTPAQRGRYPAYRLHGLPNAGEGKDLHVRASDGKHQWFPAREIDRAYAVLEARGGILEHLNGRGQVTQRVRRGVQA